ncbi:hypothetical protein MASR2M70_09430 [Bacillota bacterium]
MALIGEWTGKLYHKSLCEYVEDEYFKIEILSISDENEITAKVTEEIRTPGLCPCKVSIKEPYKALGRRNPAGNNLRLSYTAYNNRGESCTVEIAAAVDIECRSMKGSYMSYHGKGRVCLEFQLSLQE